ncbi:MAG: YceI family protein, partial [Deinococcus sp.]|nr:YceI family protein [Deinococcus sp.]
SDQFPLACFRSTGLRFPDGVPVGDEEVSIELEGFLELKGVEQPVTLSGAAQLSGRQLIAAASTTVLLSHYGIPQPEAPFIPGVAAGGMVRDAVEVNIFIVAR